jgi:putative FmdB family regulatory protein
MPLYEYGCPSCGLVSDVRHGFDEKPEVKCERCGTALVRRFSAAPIVFKGSGFYVTDSRSSSASATPKADGGDKPAAEKTEPAKPAEPKKSDKEAAA